jgi:hypothetical protein
VLLGCFPSRYHDELRFAGRRCFAVFVVLAMMSAPFRQQIDKESGMLRIECEAIRVKRD